MELKIHYQDDRNSYVDRLQAPYDAWADKDRTIVFRKLCSDEGLELIMDAASELNLTIKAVFKAGEPYTTVTGYESKVPRGLNFTQVIGCRENVNRLQNILTLQSNGHHR